MKGTVNITAGTVIKGKWYNKKFEIIKFLDKGGTASIFLVKEISTGTKYAMKISRDLINIDSEYRVLSRLREITFIPEVYYRDDCVIEGIPHFFFIMSYYKGKNLKEICSEKGIGIKGILQAVLILANICSQLNKYDIYYCDLKPENLIFDYTSGRLYLVDFGGIASKGEGISHFTPFFDRGSWGRGERIADEGYQIFALSMILVDLLIGRQDKEDRDFLKLVRIVKNSCLCKNIKNVIIEGLEQKCENLYAFRNKLLLLIEEIEKEKFQDERKIEFAINMCFVLSLVVFVIILAMIN